MVFPGLSMRHLKIFEVMVIFGLFWSFLVISGQFRSIQILNADLRSYKVIFPYTVL